jgi:hypothetical protein
LVNGTGCGIISGQGNDSLLIYVGYGVTEISLIITDPSGCAHICSEEIDCTMKKEAMPSDLINFEIFPNPATDVLQLNWGNNQSEISIQIFNEYGVQVWNHLDVSPENRSIFIPLHDQISGVYHLRITSGGQVYYRKFIKI